MIFWKTGAAAAEDFMVSGLARLIDTTYWGSSAGARPAIDTR